MPVDGEMYRIVLEKDTLDIWVNGKKAEVAREFVEDGVETHVRFFSQDQNFFYRIVNSFFYSLL